MVEGGFGEGRAVIFQAIILTVSPSSMTPGMKRSPFMRNLTTSSSGSHANFPVGPTLELFKFLTVVPLSKFTQKDDLVKPFMPRKRPRLRRITRLTTVHSLQVLSI